MNVAAMWKVIGSGRVGALRSLASVMGEYTRACCLVAAARAGVLARLAGGPQTLEQLGVALESGALDEVRAWLDVGVALGELRRDARGYRLRGTLARALAEAKNDDLLAMLEELTDLHHRLVLETPARAKRGARFALADHASDVIARSSRLLEPFVEAAIARAVPAAGPVRVLEVGCGSGTYLRFMSERNPELRAVGLDLSAAVIEQARANLAAWGVADRVSVARCDLREHAPDAPYDLVTLHNNIYYFPTAERVAVLSRVRELLAPNGSVLLTTATPGGSPSGTVLNLWGAMTEGCGPLPEPRELLEQMGRAGFASCRAEDLMGPLDRFHAFYGART